jgi:aspartyl-tRNA(Asn)/glutamyl-tRNA(Gln) amidotransferase subunit B
MANVSSAALASASPEARPIVANLILGPIAARLNEENLAISQKKITDVQLYTLAQRVADGTVSSSAAIQVIFPIVWAGEGLVDEIIEKRGLKQISDAGEIERLVDEVLAANAKQVEDYRSGKDKAFNSLIGQVMKASRGKANPAQVNEVLRRRLKV